MTGLTNVWVDPSINADTGRGTRATITLSAATFTFSTLNLNETNAFSSYTFVTGDQIFLSGGTAVTVGLHTIASKTDDSNIVMVADITTDSSDPTDVTSDSAPYGDLEFAIEQETFDLTNGTRLNIKAGTTETVAAKIDTAMADTVTSIAWAPLQTTGPLVFQGYTTTQGDGGQGVLSGGGLVSIYDSVVHDNVHFVDLRLTNVGSRNIITLDRECSLINCQLDNNTGESGAVTIDTGAVIGCLFTNLSTGVLCGGETRVINNRFIDAGATRFNSGAVILISGGGGAVIIGNIISITQTDTKGIEYNNNGLVMNNSVYSSVASTKPAIQPRGANDLNSVIINNIVEGFSGVGGVGINGPTGDDSDGFVAGNAVFDCTTKYANADRRNYPRDADDNEELSVSGFTDASGGDFSPVSTTGNIKEGSLPEKIGLFA